MESVVHASTRPYLQVNNVRQFIDQHAPTASSQNAKIFRNTIGGMIGGGLVGKAIPYIGELFTGLIGKIPENSTDLIKPIVANYLAPLMPSANYIPITLGGIGGTILFCFAFYREYNLSVQAATAKAVLGYDPDRYVTNMELENIYNIMPSYYLRGMLEKSFTVLHYKTFNDLLIQRDAIIQYGLKHNNATYMDNMDCIAESNLSRLEFNQLFTAECKRYLLELGKQEKKIMSAYAQGSDKTKKELQQLYDAIDKGKTETKKLIEELESKTTYVK